MMATVYVILGDPDALLSPAGFADYQQAVHQTIEEHAERLHAVWHSDDTDTPPSACIAFRVAERTADQLKAALAAVRARFGQRSIAWAEAETTLFL